MTIFTKHHHSATKRSARRHSKWRIQYAWPGSLLSHHINQVRRINPPINGEEAASKTKDYTPPEGADLAASYHILPPTGGDDDDDDDILDADGRRGVFREIVTALTHPVTFDVRWRPDDSCRFCAEPTFGLFGLSWKKVAVVAWRDGCGFTEIDGGHASYGARSERMCRACVAARFDVVSCERHVMQSTLPSTAGHTHRHEHTAKMLAMLDGTKVGQEEQAESAEWCAVCPQPAFWRCCAMNDDDDDDDHNDGGPAASGAPVKKEGCGLFLCDDCKTDWDLCGGCFAEMLERRLSTERGVMESRADAGFLLQEGLLMKNLRAELSLDNAMRH